MTAPKGIAIPDHGRESPQRVRASVGSRYNARLSPSLFRAWISRYGSVTPVSSLPVIRCKTMPDESTPLVLPLGLSITAAQEQFSKAFITAVASLAGCAAAEPRPDHDSIDWTLSCRLHPRRPKLDLQVKSVSTPSGEGARIRYALKRKNYDELIPTELLAPRLLVLVVVPAQPTAWLSMSPDALILRHCAYWASLRGLPSTENDRSVTVEVPRANLFDVEALTRLMHVINEGGVP